MRKLFLTLFALVAFFLTVSSAAQGQTLLNNLSAWYDLNCTDPARDRSPNKYNLTATGTLTCSGDGLNNTESSAIYFGGGAYYSDATDWVKLPTNNQARTFAVITRAAELAANDWIFYQGAAAGGANFHADMGEVNATSVRFGASASSSDYYINAGGGLSVGTWMCLIFEYNGSSAIATNAFTVYKNNIPMTGSAGADGDPLATPAGRLILGAYYDHTSNSYLGNISLFAIWNRTLTAAERGAVCAGADPYEWEITTPPPSATNWTIGANNNYTSAVISSFNLTLSNSTWHLDTNTTDGAVSMDNITGTYWLAFAAPGFMPRNVSQTLALSTVYNKSLWKAYATFFLHEYVSNASISVFNLTIGNLSLQTTTNGSLGVPLDDGTYTQFNLSADGYYLSNHSVTISALTQTIIRKGTGSALIRFWPQTYLNGTNISAFNIDLVNDPWSENKTSAISALDWKYLINGTYTATVNVTDYFPHIGTLTVTNKSASYRPRIWQAEEYVSATDVLSGQTISTIVVRDQFNTEWNATNNVSALYLDVGWWNLTVTAPGYTNYSYTYTPTARSNHSTAVTLTPMINYSIIDERTLAPFDVASADTATLDVFCTDQTLHWDFKVEGGNASSGYIGVGCTYYLVKLNIGYNGSSYYRTLVPASTARNVTFYMVNLETDTVVQRIIHIIDMTNEFSGGSLRVQKYITTDNKDIIKQPWDLENTVTLYLWKDEMYVLSVINAAGTERSLGNLVASTAGEQTILLPEISFAPGFHIGQDIFWSYTFNASQNLLRAQYIDYTNSTTSVTFMVFNMSNSTADSDKTLVFSSTSAASNVTFTYNGIQVNTTYLSWLMVNYPGETYNDSQIWNPGSVGILELEGWDTATTKNIKQGAVFIFIFCWLMLFSRRFAAVGAVTTVFWLWLFKSISWFNMNVFLLSICSIVAVLFFLTEGMKK